MEKILKKHNLSINSTNIYLLNSLQSMYPDIFSLILNEIDRTAVPDFTLLNIEKILSKVESFSLNREIIKYLVKIASFSPFLTQIISKNCDKLLNYLFIEKNLTVVKDKDKFVSELKVHCSNSKNISSLKKSLRIFKQQEFLRIGSQDICKIMHLEQITFQLSELAAAFVEYSIDWLSKNYFKQIDIDTIIILGMGKLAGKELNFSSDIDLIYLYINEKENLKHVYINFFETLTKLINDITEDGFVFRVDLRLRPDGINGPIAMDIENATFYYENFGRLWERGVLLKARPIAGNISKGEAFLNELKPFIYRRHLDFRVAEEIFQMKEKINKSIKKDAYSNNIKLGIGGIREIEFIMQAIQLIFGGKYIDIREKNCLKFFKIIKKYKILSAAQIELLIFAYKFLRILEHKIQIFHEKQSHSLPENINEMKIIADFFGFKDINYFIKYQLEIREKVHNIFNNFIKFKDLEVKNNHIDSINFSSKEELTNILENLNLDESVVSLLFNFFNSIPEENEDKIKEIFSYIFKSINMFINRETILINFVNLMDKIKFNSGYISFLLKNRIAIEILMNIFSKSVYLSNIILKYKEIFEEIFFTDFFKINKSKNEFVDEIDNIVKNSLTYEDILENLRIYKQKEHLRLGLHFLNKKIEIKELLLQLTYLADSLFEKSFQIVKAEFEKKYGKIFSEVTIIALGKFGSRELNFSSDLDIVLIIEKNINSEKGINCIEYFSRFLQRLISFISIRTRNGIMYEIDTRLRPSGNSGTLVTTFDAFKEYHNKSSAIWELQALLKARSVAGNEKFSKKTLEFIKKVILKKDITFNDIKEILRIRKRIELEEAKETDKIIDIKSGKGGIIDVEFLVQILMLKNKIVYNNGNTIDNLILLKEKGILEDEYFENLYSNYLYLRSIENIIRMHSESHTDKINLQNNNLFNKDEINNIINAKENIRKIFNKVVEGINGNI